ncbi:type I CRISPR-associated protein Cas7 [Chitinophaga solisilvae]|uniref:type I CRISPR-associated protein Cas7 n=1 Tax=Chitinophaga solisilvae TaxID=1233460 RepID=UPI00136B2D84|nr:type I CRISPR-associated protein Cas7 [Chitinophaga solisilvae]
MNSFNNRVYGAAIIKSVNSNYNADFSGMPRKLPSGTVYATDKVLKYSIRNYWRDALNEKVFYFKSLSEDMSPRSLDETYSFHFGDSKEKDKNKMRLEVLSNLLQCLDVRLFGGTYAGKTNISIHGTCQITPGLNRYPDNVIYTEQIMSPFRNSNDAKADSKMTTLGSQSRLQEGHYVHHFSINPKNIADDVERTGVEGLTQQDINHLKEGLKKGVTYYDSAAKAGTENELLLWIQLKPDAKIVLPSFVSMIDINEEREIDLSRVSELLEKDYVKSEVEKVEIYYNKLNTKILNEPAGAIISAL